MRHSIHARLPASISMWFQPNNYPHGYDGTFIQPLSLYTWGMNEGEKRKPD